MHEDEKRRVEVKKRRHEETVKREKLSYWHLIKRDVLKYKKEIATQDAHQRIAQSKLMTKWLHHVGLKKLIGFIYDCFTHRKKVHDDYRKKHFLVKHAWL